MFWPALVAADLALRLLQQIVNRSARQLSLVPIAFSYDHSLQPSLPLALVRCSSMKLVLRLALLLQCLGGSRRLAFLLLQVADPLFKILQFLLILHLQLLQLLLKILQLLGYRRDFCRKTP